MASADPPAAKRVKCEAQDTSTTACWASESPAAVLDFWFGKDYEAQCDSTKYLQDRFQKWFFGRDAMFDIRQLEAAPAIEAAARGALAGGAWEEPRGLLAQVLLCDQFSRTAFRGTAKAFAFDDRATVLAKQLGAANGTWCGLRAVERFFLCVALSHSEDLETNRLHVELAKKIATDATPADVAAFFSGLKGFPDEHFECVQRFGRFPHRNEALGRQSTEPELAWLESPSCPGWARSQDPARLHYWYGRGLGEPIRMLLHFACVPFRDEFVRSRSELDALRFRGVLPFGQVPLYEDRDGAVAQTQAILRHVARKRGLLGEGKAAADADSVVNAVLDARQPLITFRFQPDAKAACDKFVASTLPKIAGQLEHWLSSRSAGERKVTYFAGDSTTYADIVVLEFLEYVADEAPEVVAASGELASGHPELFAWWRHMRGFAHLSAYLDSPSRVPKPCDDFVRRTCEILAMPLPQYLLPAEAS